MADNQKRDSDRAKPGLVHTNYELRWKNYRRFKDTGWLTIRPVTVLIGPNNSGKSSVLAPLLLLNQTIASSDSEAPLVTRGRLVDVGNYRDFVHKHDYSNELFFGVRFHTHKLPKRAKRVGAYPPGAVEIALSQGKEPQQLRLNKYELFDIFARPYVGRALRGDGTYSLDGVISFDKMTDHEKKAIASSRPVNFLFSPNQTLYSLELPDKPDEQTRPTRFSEAFSHYLQAVGFAYSEVRSLFQNLSYVGPLRRKIQRYYRVAAETPATVGPQGENAPHLFRRNRRNLQAEVNAWVKQFEFGDSLSCNQLTDDLFQLVLKNGSEETNLADVGFGASQVLPLIIQALAAPRDSLTLAEQPEIHLNPRLQCVLADLFVHMANSGHRVLLETHSEHLLTRLRRLVASGDIGASDVALYFVEREGADSTIKEVPIQRNGHIDANVWPRGFFEDALRESLALATAQARAKGSQ